jgi:hypothetical protein
MNAWVVVALTLFAPIGAPAQSADSPLSTELPQLHSEWFTAFNAGMGRRWIGSKWRTW